MACQDDAHALNCLLVAGGLIGSGIPDMILDLEIEMAHVSNVNILWVVTAA